MSAHLTWGQLVDYWAGDLGEAETAAADEHLFACDPCADLSAALSRVTLAIRRAIPSVLAPGELEALREGHVVVDNDFRAGTTPVLFPAGVDLLVHHLGGLDLTEAERVEVTVKLDSGEVLFEELLAPFDRARGEVLIACQRHFAHLPPVVVFEVRVHPGQPAPTVFVIPHEFPVVSG